MHTVTELRIVTSGTDGHNGHHGSSGSSATSTAGDGANGGDATASTRGAPANPINLRLDRLGDQVRARWDAERSIILPYGNSAASIYLEAKGGKGGRGGDGGSGGAGAMGYPGTDATTGSYGTDGSTGGVGGDGGDATDGSPGGAGANITVFIDEQDSDLLMLLNRAPDCSGGTGGAGGSSGNGGGGGSGGPGGSSHSWSTTTDTSYYQSNSEGGGTWVYSTQTNWHTNPGGGVGPSGKHGSSGRAGFPGADGAAGVYSICLKSGQGDSWTSYTDYYDLLIAAARIGDPTGNCVLEPGARFPLFFNLQNTSLMPTPRDRQIFVGVVENSWITTDGLMLGVKTPFAGNQACALETPLWLHVSHPLSVAQGNPLRQTVTLNYEARLEGVNKRFERVHAQQSKVTVSYPFELADLRCAPVISATEEAPLAFSITNVGRAAWKGERTLRVELSLQEGPIPAEAMEFVSEDGRVSRFGEPISFTPGEMAPGETERFTGSVRFVSRDIPPQSRATLVTRLYLESLDDHQVRPIQERTCQVQYAETFQSTPAHGGLLVMHGETTAEELEAWGELGALLDIPFARWNLSLYRGIDFETRFKGQPSLLEQFNGKLIVFTHPPVSNTQSMLPAAQLYRAARSAQLATYIFGAAQPLIGTAAAAHEQGGLQFPNVRGLLDFVAANPVLISIPSVPMSRIGCVGRSALKQAARLHRQLARQVPHYAWTVSYDTDALVMQVHRGLALGRTRMAYTRPMPVNQRAAYVRSDENLYNIVKLLPLERKCALLVKLGDFGARWVVVRNALISDLAQEYRSLLDSEWAGKHRRSDIEVELHQLRELVNLVLHNPALKALVVPELLRYLWSLYASSSVIYNGPRRLYLASRNLIAPVITKTEWKAVCRELKRRNPIEMLGSFLVPQVGEGLLVPVSASGAVTEQSYVDGRPQELPSTVELQPYHFEDHEQRKVALEAQSAQLKASRPEEWQGELTITGNQ